MRPRDALAVERLDKRGRNGAVNRRIVRLRIELQELEPRNRRRIDMPLSATLEALHEAIQMTMGWTFSHLREFDLDRRCYGDPSFREFDDEPVIHRAKGLRLGTAIARGADRFPFRRPGRRAGLRSSPSGGRGAPDEFCLDRNRPSGDHPSRNTTRTR